MKDAREQAPWRSTTRTLKDLLLDNFAAGIVPTPILGFPGVRDLSIFRVDWLHAVDQGVGLDWFGAVMWFLISSTKFYAGASREERLRAMWRSINIWYDSHRVADRLHKLTLLMLKKDKSTSMPKLKCMAGVCRALEGWVHDECNKLLDASDGVEGAILHASNHFHECFELLRRSTIYRKDLMMESGRKFVLLYASLAEKLPRIFRCKPKVHLFLHLIQESDPKRTWTYRDEDWGGTASRLSRRRGARMGTKPFSSNTLDRFRMEPMIRIR